MLGEMSRWLGEAGRGPQRLVGALETKEECVCDLHGSGLVTWVLCLPEPEGKKKEMLEVYTRGSQDYQEKGLFETQRERVYV